jgi:hypothetical protein
MKIYLLQLATAALLFTACDTANTSRNNEEAIDRDSVATETENENGSIELTMGEESPDFPDAMLEQTAPQEGAKLQAGSNTFQYNIKNFQLTQMTEDAMEKHLANSGQGQHIHLILNNEPYTALYETTHKKDLSEGHYVELSFLSRSYHESIKHPDAYVLRQFTVGNATAEDVDLTAPHMFYSRPKGEYTGKDTEKVMLDFYLVNADLADDGYKIRATVNGQEFMINQWKPYYLTGLPMGENTIKLELMDEDGNLVDSPFNPVTRTITLSAGSAETM